ncbi:GNAT family N-acetyltransferase [Paenibacillus alba]|uniref:GNAT family N-acetyltransferase n=1 Tax=Paenibacillus alba TaxID=1197127 RepID=A0ABU6GDG2_9BACL|nr:GNAT family N-acetyltransferase [Paenibacillus alba]MEC0230818.1 GNAT family N-acetyltransferase [Paenibacillus alba]
MQFYGLSEGRMSDWHIYRECGVVIDMYKDDLNIRQYQLSDAAAIVEMINRDPFHLQKGITVDEFERYLDEPGAKSRENTFVAVRKNQIIGYISLSFVSHLSGRKVDSYSGIDVDWRRKGYGTRLIQFILEHLNQYARSEKQTIHFVLRVDSRTSGMLELALVHGMVKRHELLILRNCKIDQAQAVPLLKNYFFRSPTPQDAAIWASIYNDAFNGNKTIESVVHEFASVEFSPELNILAFTIEGEPAAFISSRMVAGVGQIPTIAVKPSFQRLGLGKALLLEILYRFKKAGANEVTLSVNTANHKAIGLYENNGFTQCATRGYYYKTISPSDN